MLQRCWAHLLREAKDLTETTPGRHFHLQLTALFHEVKEFMGAGHSQEQRDARATQFEKELIQLTTYYSRYPELKKLCGYISNGMPYWFTCIRKEGIEPTNNPAEQKLRPIVIKRKISQHTWSEDGQRCLEVFYTLEQTCRERGENFADLVRNEIEGNLAEMRKS